MASLDKLPPTARYPKGRYKVRYKKPDGTAGSRNLVRRDEAVRFQQANGADIDRGDWIDPSARRSKFDSWAASYERSLVRLAPITSRRYSQYLHNHVLPFFAGWPIASIDYQDVEDFIGHLFEKKDAKGVHPGGVLCCQGPLVAGRTARLARRSAVRHYRVRAGA